MHATIEHCIQMALGLQSQLMPRYNQTCNACLQCMLWSSKLHTCRVPTSQLRIMRWCNQKCYDRAQCIWNTSKFTFISKCNIDGNTLKHCCMNTWELNSWMTRTKPMYILIWSRIGTGCAYTQSGHMTHTIPMHHRCCDGEAICTHPILERDGHRNPWIISSTQHQHASPYYKYQQ